MWESFASFGPWAMTAALLSWLLIQTFQTRKNGNGNGHHAVDIRIARIETMVEDDREDLKAIRQALAEQTAIMTRLLTLFEQHVREDRKRD